ncbi:MAG: hypothetical protein QOE99_1369, partial [Actinomycetota bacterium]|nr:hypothetical protein [Actinomycetota bacterium]
MKTTLPGHEEDVSGNPADEPADEPVLLLSPREGVPPVTVDGVQLAEVI